VSHVTHTSYKTRRDQLEAYFDRTASQAWKRLTSTDPVSGIRATVRAGRDAMRAQLLGWLPQDLSGTRILDAGCGTGALAVAAAQRGAHVVAVDVAGSLVDVARERTPDELAPRISYHVGDMLDAQLGTFDHVVAMDSLIHYDAADIVRVLEAIGPRTHRSFVFTFAPATPALRAMHIAGRLFPRSDRAPAIAPVSQSRLRMQIKDSAPLNDWTIARDGAVTSGFYISHGLELTRR